MISLMGIYEADISLLVCDQELKDEKFVYPDLKYAIQHAQSYHPPIVEPENSHLRIVKNPDPFRACKELGMMYIKCDVPDSLKDAVQRYNLKPLPEEGDRLCHFYDRPSGPFQEKGVLDVIAKCVGKQAQNVIFHPLAGCIEIHYSTELNSYSINNRIILGFELEPVVGGPLRSVNGRRFPKAQK